MAVGVRETSAVVCMDFVDVLSVLRINSRIDVYIDAIKSVGRMRFYF